MNQKEQREEFKKILGGEYLKVISDYFGKKGITNPKTETQFSKYTIKNVVYGNRENLIIQQGIIDCLNHYRSVRKKIKQDQEKIIA